MPSTARSLSKKIKNKGGRPKGALGRKGRLVEQLMDEMEYDPIQAMIDLATNPDVFDIETGERISLEMKIQLHKELAQYRYPKRKSVEIESGAGPIPIAVFCGVVGAPGSAVEPEPED